MPGKGLGAVRTSHFCHAIDVTISCWFSALYSTGPNKMLLHFYFVESSLTMVESNTYLTLMFGAWDTVGLYISPSHGIFGEAGIILWIILILLVETICFLSHSWTTFFLQIWEIDKLWKLPLYSPIVHNYSLRRRANARNVSFRISLRWLTYTVNSVDKTKLSCNTPTDAAPQFL